MSKTCTRVFGNIVGTRQFGHAYLNALNVKSVIKAKKELLAMLEDIKKGK